MRLRKVTDQPGAFAYMQAKHPDNAFAATIAIDAPRYLCPDWATSP